MKKLLALLLALAMCFAMFACGAEEKKSKKDDKDDEAIAELEEEIEALEDEIAELEEELEDADEDEKEELEEEIKKLKEDLEEKEDELKKLESDDEDEDEDEDEKDEDDKEVDYDDLDADELEDAIADLEEEIADLEDELEEAEDDEDEDAVEELEAQIKKLEKELKKAEKALAKLEDDGDKEEITVAVEDTWAWAETTVAPDDDWYWADATEAVPVETVAPDEDWYWAEATQIAPVETEAVADDWYWDDEPEGKVYKFVTNTTYIPFEYYEYGELAGFDIDLLAAIAKDQGFEYVIYDTSWDDALGQVESGQVDAMISAVSINDQREATFDFSNPYFEDGLTLITTDTELYIYSVNDLRGKTVGAVDWTSYAIDELASEYGFTATYYSNSEDLYNALESGAIEAGFDWYPTICNTIREEHRRLWASGERFDSYYYGMLVKDGENEELLDMFNEGLENIIADGRYDQICNKYGFIY